MKYYFKILLLSMAIGFINILIFIFLLQFQIVHNSGYIPEEAVTFIIILIGIPVQFLILLLISLISKRSQLATKITSSFFIVVCFLLLWFTSNEERELYSNEQIYNKTEKYDYQQGISTPEGYPIKLLSESKFTVAVKGDSNPYTLLETGKVYSTQWGLGDTTFKSSDEGGVVVPDSLKLYWYSFLENKYYGLNSKIDKKKISDYFKNGYRWDISGNIDQIIPTTYKELIAGIAPNGDVVLWISGHHDVKEIEVFKAKEMKLQNFKDYDQISGETKNEVLSDTCTCADRPQFRRIVHHNKSIPTGKWITKYRKKFNWKIKINNFGQTKQELNFYLFNGEKYSLFNEEVAKTNFQHQGVPDFIKFIFIKNQKKHTVYLEFNEEEVINNFEKLSGKNINDPIEMVLSINPDLSQAKIHLQSKDNNLNFEKMKEIKISSKE